MEALYGYSVVAELRPGTRYDEVARALGGHGELVSAPAELARRSNGPSLAACLPSSTSSPTPTSPTRADPIWPEQGRVPLGCANKDHPLSTRPAEWPILATVGCHDGQEPQPLHGGRYGVGRVRQGSRRSQR